MTKNSLISTKPLAVYFIYLVFMMASLGWLRSAQAYSGCTYGEDYLALDESNNPKCTFSKLEIESCFPDRAREPLRCVRTSVIGAKDSCDQDPTTGKVYKNVVDPITKLSSKILCNAITLRHGTPNECTIELSTCPFLEVSSNRTTGAPVDGQGVFFVSKVSTTGNWFRVTVIQNGFAPDIDQEIINYVRDKINWNTIGLDPGIGIVSPNISSLTPNAAPYSSFAYSMFSLKDAGTRSAAYPLKTIPSVMTQTPLLGKKKNVSFVDSDDCRQLPREGTTAATALTPAVISGSKSLDYEDYTLGGNANPTKMTPTLISKATSIPAKACCRGKNMPAPPPGYMYESKPDFWRRFCSIKAWQILFWKDPPSPTKTTTCPSWPNFEADPVSQLFINKRPINPAKVSATCNTQAVPPISPLTDPSCDRYKEGEAWSVSVVRVHEQHSPDEHHEEVQVKNQPVAYSGLRCKFSD